MEILYEGRVILAILNRQIARSVFVRVNAMMGMTDTRTQVFKMAG